MESAADRYLIKARENLLAAEGEFSSGQLINRRKRYPAELQRILPDNQELRNLADYPPDFVTQTQAGRALARGRTFVEALSRQKGNDS